jgi:hypothetical protein
LSFGKENLVLNGKLELLLEKLKLLVAGVPQFHAFHQSIFEDIIWRVWFKMSTAKSQAHTMIINRDA